MGVFLRLLLSQFSFLFGSIWALVGTPFLIIGVMHLNSGKEGAWIFALLGAIFAGVGWPLAVMGWRKAFDAWDVLSNGVPIPGQVLAVEVVANVQINNRNPLRLAYHFTGPDGLPHEGRSPYLPRRLEGRWKAGDTVMVCCDPGNAGRHQADIFGVRSPL